MGSDFWTQPEASIVEVVKGKEHAHQTPTALRLRNWTLLGWVIREGAGNYAICTTIRIAEKPYWSGSRGC